MTGSGLPAFLPPELPLLLHNVEIEDVPMLLCGRRGGTCGAHGGHRDPFRSELSLQS